MPITYLGEVSESTESWLGARMSAEKSLTHARALELFDYNPDTGVITWKVAKARRVRAWNASRPYV